MKISELADDQARVLENFFSSSLIRKAKNGATTLTITTFCITTLSIHDTGHEWHSI